MKSKIALFVIALVYLVSFKQYANYNSFLQGGGDSWGYYAYLPASFIYHDLDDLQQTIQKRAEYNPSSVRTQEDGYLQIEEAHAFQKNTIIKYTSGISILYAPFFLAAHGFCKLTHLYAADGYTFPYNLMIGLSTLLYSIFGLWLIRKILINYFTDSITAITLIIIGIGTNLYFFSVSHLGMSHPYLFALYALCLFATHKFYEKSTFFPACLIGFSCGMISMIRPNEVIILLFPLLWNVFSLNGFKNRLLFIFRNSGYYVVMAFIFLLCWLPQIFYWKTLTGKIFFYSYTKEGFDFLHPHLKNGLFGFANGWLAYTPIMIFAVIGLIFLPKYFKKTAAATYLFMPVFVYVIYSWWCWQYINGFGSRPMVETYPIWAFPLACFLLFIWNKSIIKTVSFLLMAFLLFVNLFQTWQFEKGLIWTEDSNWAFYKAIFLKTKSNYDAHIAYDCGETQPDTTKLKRVNVLQIQEFKDLLSSDYITFASKSAPYAFELHEGTTPTLQFRADTSGIQARDYIKISCMVYCNELQYDHYKQAVLAATFLHGGNQIRWRCVRLQTKIDNKDHLILHIGKERQWQHVYFFVRVPHRFKDAGDLLQVNVWNPSNMPVIVDDVQVELWRKK